MRMMKVKFIKLDGEKLKGQRQADKKLTRENAKTLNDLFYQLLEEKKKICKVDVGEFRKRAIETVRKVEGAINMSRHCKMPLKKKKVTTFERGLHLGYIDNGSLIIVIIFPSSIPLYIDNGSLISSLYSHHLSPVLRNMFRDISEVESDCRMDGGGDADSNNFGGGPAVKLLFDFSETEPQASTHDKPHITQENNQ
ncbi:2398_t:CDS:2 [Paraglomus occultum]|uniref:2398_t:CDS:1 n=1 Tax=Paraglomus occultum TaxID=144539 RepID=A0A9N8ZN22_9GLOM|nr:2398_t:CDS:2 [Paraglomus occultum]